MLPSAKKNRDTKAGRDVSAPDFVSLCPERPLDGRRRLFLPFHRPFDEARQVGVVGAVLGRALLQCVVHQGADLLGVLEAVAAGEVDGLRPDVAQLAVAVAEVAVYQRLVFLE